MNQRLAKLLVSYVATSTALALLLVFSVGNEVPSPGKLTTQTGQENRGLANAITPVQATWSDAFVDSIGVNIHSDEPTYSSGSTFTTTVIPKLNEIGIRHVRESLFPYQSGLTYYANRMKTLTDSGVKLNLVPASSYLNPDPTTKLPNTASMVSALNSYLTLGVSIATIEGQNEYNHPTVWAPGAVNSSWPSFLQAHTRELYSALKANPQTSSIPFVGPTIITYAGPGLLGSLADTVDIGNGHYYCDYWGDYPSVSPPDQTAECNFNDWSVFLNPWGSKPIYITETGYPSAANLSSVPGPIATYVLSEDAAASYTMQRYLSFYKRGFKRTFYYELSDLDRVDLSSTSLSRYWGLLTSTHQEKKSATILKNTISLLRDSAGAPTNLGSLSYSLSNSSNLENLLFQKKDGSYYLALWRKGAYTSSTSSSTLQFSNQVELKTHSPVSGSSSSAFSNPATSHEITVGSTPIFLEMRTVNQSSGGGTTQTTSQPQSSNPAKATPTVSKSGATSSPASSGESTTQPLPEGVEESNNPTSTAEQTSITPTSPSSNVIPQENYTAVAPLFSLRQLQIAAVVFLNGLLLVAALNFLRKHRHVLVPPNQQLLVR